MVNNLKNADDGSVAVTGGIVLGICVGLESKSTILSG
jgi:hypothetical protein